MSVDRIEGEIAVCINDIGQAFAIKVENIDGKPHEGSILFDMGNGRYMCSGEEEEKRRKENAERLKKIMLDEQK